MGTMLMLAYVMWPRLLVLHAGDSRCYLLRGSRLEQITTDHSMAQQLMQGGTLGPQDAVGSRWSCILQKVIGGQADVVGPEVYQADLQPQDVLLLYWDGLTRHVSAAIEAGGTDNVTVVVVRFQEARSDVSTSRADETAISLVHDTDVFDKFASTSQIILTRVRRPTPEVLCDVGKPSVGLPLLPARACHFRTCDTAEHTCRTHDRNRHGNGAKPGDPG